MTFVLWFSSCRDGCYHPIPQVETHPLAQEVSFADYMNGGEGMAYHDRTKISEGGQVRLCAKGLRGASA